MLRQTPGLGNFMSLQGPPSPQLTEASSTGHIFTPGDLGILKLQLYGCTTRTKDGARLPRGSLSSRS